MKMLYIKYTSFVSCCCREDFFIYFHYKSMVDNDMPGTWPVWTPGAPLAGFIKRNTIHCYKQYMKALGLVVLEKKIFLCFSHDAPGAVPVWTTGTVGRIYKDDHYMLQTKYESSGPCGFGEDFFYVLPMTLPPPPRGGARMDPRGTVGRIYKEDHYTLLLTKHESSGPCGFGEEDF